MMKFIFWIFVIAFLYSFSFFENEKVDAEISIMKSQDEISDLDWQNRQYQQSRKLKKIEDTEIEDLKIIQLIADTIWLEARSEELIGQLAVATVIWNRAGGDKKLFKEVILKKDQFTCWSNGTPTVKRFSLEYDRAKEIGRCMVDGIFQPVGDWTHYYNPRLASPSWGNKKGFVVGNHKFIKLK